MIDKNIIFIVGFTGSGKSYLSEQYKKHGYYVISADEIIRENLMKDSSDGIHFLLYNDNKSSLVPESKKVFIKIIKNLIKKYNKVVIEGQLQADIINEITGKNKFEIILVKPKNKAIWTKNIINRFVEDPANYGRVGRLKKYDEENNKIGLDDYIKNGIEGKYIKKLINKVISTTYNKQAETKDYYKQKFNNLKIYLS